jgi:hypothetical protein
VSAGDDPYAERKKLTFEQAEGLAPLPRQLAQGEITQEFRAVLWDTLNKIIKQHTLYTTVESHAYFQKPWSTILNDLRVYRYHRLDTFPEGRQAIAEVKKVIVEGSWSDVLGWLEFVLKHSACPRDLPKEVNAIMAYCHLAYRVFDGTVICPVGSDAERQTMVRSPIS